MLDLTDKSNFNDFFIDDGGNLPEMDEMESYYLEKDETSFALHNSNLLTPFHSSLTNIMSEFGFKLCFIYGRGDDYVEIYADEDKNNALLRYSVAAKNLDITTNKDVLKIQKDFIVLNPILEMYTEKRKFGISDTIISSIDLRNLLPFYTKNNFVESIRRYIKSIDRMQSRPTEYIK